MHISFSPYVEYFFTEGNNFDILDQIKKQTNLLNKTEIIRYSEVNNFISK